MNFKAWLPTIVAAGSAALVAVTPSIQHGLAGFAGNHPAVAVGISAALGIFSHLWPSPVSK